MSRKRTGDDLGIASGGADIDAVAGDRIELVEVHHVLARLAVDPVDRRLDRQLPQMIAEICATRRGSRRSGNFRRSSAARSAGRDGRARDRASARAPAFRCQERSGTVADDDDFLGVGARARRRRDAARSGRCAGPIPGARGARIPRSRSCRTGDRARRWCFPCISARCRAGQRRAAAAAAMLNRSGMPRASRPFSNTKAMAAAHAASSSSTKCG